MAILTYGVIFAYRRYLILHNITQSTAKFRGGGGEFILKKDNGEWEAS